MGINNCFDKTTYINRRLKLRNTVNSGLILLFGNDESPMNYRDNTYHFRQDSNFLYYFGLNQPGLVGIIDCDTGVDWIFGNDLSIDDIVWTGPQPTVADQALKAGITSTASINDLVNKLKNYRQSSQQIHLLPPYRAENKIKIFEWLGIILAKQQEHASLPLIKAVINQRNYKTDEEIKEITRAVNTSVDMHTLAMRMAKPGVSEAHIAASVQEVAVAAGGQISFPVIATINGQTLHNHDHGNILQDGDLFLLDAGAETNMGYCGDLSSTIPVNGNFDSRQHDIYNLCLNSHNAAINMLKPGIKFKEVYFESARVILNGLKDLGLVKGNIEDALMRGAHALFFPCGLGHMMGLDVHDMEDLGEVYVGYDGEAKSDQFGLKSLRLGRTLEPGFVLTIEPGIYFIPELIDQWQSTSYNSEFINFNKVNEYRTFGGLRNEENFLITETGYQLLGKNKPKTIEDVLSEWAKGV